MKIKAETMFARLESGRNYRGETLITRLGLAPFQDYVASGRLVWIKDDTDGSKLYRKNV